MTRKPPSGLFITGTNTAVGKTFYAAALARSLAELPLRVGVYKPALSGWVEPSPVAEEVRVREDAALSGADDDVQLWRAAGCPGELQWVTPQRFRAPLAPHLAAQAEGRSIDPEQLRSGLQPWREVSDIVLVEGAGGLFSPLGDHELNADLAREFAFPLVLVAANTLGVIHATLATLLAARAYAGGLPVAAIVLNDVAGPDHDLSRSSNWGELQRRCAPIPVVRHAHGDRRVRDLAWLLHPPS